MGKESRVDAASSPDPRETRDDAYRRHCGYLISVAMNNFGLPLDTAKDIVHDVFVRFCSGRYQIRDGRPWLLKAVINACHDYHRSPRRREIAAELTEPRATSAESPDELLSRFVSVTRAIRQLNPKQRQVVELHYFEGLRSREIADRLHTSTGYVEQLIHDALLTLRGALGVAKRRPG